MEAAHASLDQVQQQLAMQMTDVGLQEKEKQEIENLQYWMSIQESIYKQKERVEWIKLGDSNSKYFYSVMKHRQCRNRIDSIFTEAGELLKAPDPVANEMISLYKKWDLRLLGFLVLI